MERLKSRKKLFELYEENWKEKNNSEEQKKWQKMRNRIKQKEIDLSDMKEHEKKYETIINQKKRQFHRKRMEVSRSVNSNEQNV